MTASCLYEGVVRHRRRTPAPHEFRSRLYMLYVDLDELYDEYKATREKMPDELDVQIARIRQVVEAFNIPVLEKEGFEADDILGTIARQARAKGQRIGLVPTMGSLHEGHLSLIRKIHEQCDLAVGECFDGGVEVPVGGGSLLQSELPSGDGDAFGEDVRCVAGCEVAVNRVELLPRAGTVAA